MRHACILRCPIVCMVLYSFFDFMICVLYADNKLFQFNSIQCGDSAHRKTVFSLLAISQLRGCLSAYGDGIKTAGQLANAFYELNNSSTQVKCTSVLSGHNYVFFFAQFSLFVLALCLLSIA